MIFFSPGSAKAIHYKNSLNVHAFNGVPPVAAAIEVTDADLLQAALDQSALRGFRAFSPLGEAHSKLRDLQQKNGDVWVCIPHSKDFMYALEVLEAADAMLGPPLHTAVQQGSLERVQHYLNCPHAIQKAILQGDTPLMLAVRDGKIAIAQALLEAGAQSNARHPADHGLTPIMKAADMGNAELIHLLVKHGAEVNAVDNALMPALIFAARHGHLDAVQALLHAQADVNATIRPVNERSLGYSALLVAAKNGHVDTVNALLEANADSCAVGPQGKTALMLGVESGNFHLVTALLQYKNNVNATDAKNVTALMMATRKGDVEMVRALLQAGARVDMVDSLGISWTDSKSKQVTDLLKQAQADLEQKIGKGSMAEMTMKYVESCNVAENKTLFERLDIVGSLLGNMRPWPGTKAAVYDGGVKNAIKTGDVEFIATMHRFGTLFIDDYLLIAIRDGNAAGVDTLLQAGADANFKFVWQVTPLMIASHLGHSDIVKTLVAAGANVSAISEDGQAALLNAVYQGNKNIVEILINAQVGIDIERGKKTGVVVSTPGNQEAMAKKLLQAKVDTASVNELWKAAQACASQNGRTEIDEMLKVAKIEIGYTGEEKSPLQVLALESERVDAVHAKSQSASAVHMRDVDIPAGAMSGAGFPSMDDSFGGPAAGNALRAEAHPMETSEEAAPGSVFAQTSGSAWAPASTGAYAAALASAHAAAPASAYAAALASGKAAAAASAYTAASAHAAASTSAHAAASASAHAAAPASASREVPASAFNAASASASGWGDSTVFAHSPLHLPATTLEDPGSSAVDHDMEYMDRPWLPQPLNAVHEGRPLQEDEQAYLLLPPPIPDYYDTYA